MPGTCARPLDDGKECGKSSWVELRPTLNRDEIRFRGESCCGRFLGLPARNAADILPHLSRAHERGI